MVHGHERLDPDTKVCTLGDGIRRFQTLRSSQGKVTTLQSVATQSACRICCSGLEAGKGAEGSTVLTVRGYGNYRWFNIGREFHHSRFDQIPAALTQISPTRDHPCRARRSGGPTRRCVTLLKCSFSPRGNIASQALSAIATQFRMWCIVGACETLPSVDLFCSVLLLLGTRTKGWGRQTRELSSPTVCG